MGLCLLRDLFGAMLFKTYWSSLRTLCSRFRSRLKPFPVSVPERFRAIDSVSDDIDRADESTLYRVVHLPEEDQFFPNCVRLIPSVAHSSTRYAFGVTAWAGVRILSLDTGKVVDSWDPDMSHSGLFRRGIIKLRVSEQHGLLVLFTGTVEDE
jgi:hypothetical protein